MSREKLTDSVLIEASAIFITLSLYVASFAGAFYTGEYGHVFDNFFKLMVIPCPIMTDSFNTAGLSASLLNVAACGSVCVIAMLMFRGETKPNAFAGFMLVIAHSFFGLNLLNMLPLFFAPFFYMRIKSLSYKDNLHVCMFSTCFGPWITEFLFRYTQGKNYVPGSASVTGHGILLVLVFMVIIGLVAPAILPGANAWHKGYQLFNGGLAFGIFGFFLYNFFYTSIGAPIPGKLTVPNEIYDSFGRSFREFANVYFSIVFLVFIIAGFILNGRSFRGYKKLIHDPGHMSNFATRYGVPVCFINIGLYGFFMLIYFNLITLPNEAAGFTGPTFGVTFAALTFSMLGQHPNNVWPVLVGFIILYVIQRTIRYEAGLNDLWVLSTQSYINGAAFSTGLAPITGKFGRRAGILAGVICASICTGTASIHGGLMLYNSGFASGLTTLIVLPVLEHYIKERRDEMPPMGMENFMAVDYKKKS